MIKELNKAINTLTRFDLYLCGIVLKFVLKLKAPCGAMF